MKTIGLSKKGSVVLLVLVPLLFLGVHGAFARGLQNTVTLYGWYAGIDGTVNFPDGSGGEFEVEASDIIEDLEFALMGGYEGRIGRWSFIIDAVYMDVGDNEDVATRAGTANVDVDVSSWLVNGGVGYDFVQNDDVVLGLVGGVRYVSLDVDVDVSLQGASRTNTSDDQSLTDGFVGLRGRIMFNDNWFMPYYADIGTGGSDLSYQLFAAIGYKFGWGDIRLGYRYLDVEMDEDKLMESLQLSGPVLGVGFRF